MEQEAQQQDIQRFLNFSLGVEEYALHLSQVREVIAIPEITPVPYTPPHFLGIMNLRGQVISVIDLRIKLGMPGDSSSETAVIICEVGPLSLGMVVSSINSVLALDATQISQRPEVKGSRHLKYVSGVAKTDQKMVLVLDVGRLLDDSDMKAIHNTNNLGIT